MKKNTKHSAESAELRRRAKSRLNERKKAEAACPRTAEDVQRLLHELEVHQIELEMQNEELRQTRAELETRQETYRNLYDFAPVGYFTVDPDGTIRKANLTGANLLGVDRSSLVNRRFGLFVSDDFRPAFNAYLNKVFAGQAKETCEITILKEGHEPLQAHIEATATKDGQECLAVVMDITERKRAEQSLQESEGRFRAIANYTVDWENWFSSDGKLLWVNPAVERLTGYSVAECFAMPAFPLPLFVEEDRAEMLKLCQDALRGTRGNDREFRCACKDGTRRWVSISWQPIFASNDTAIGYRSSVRDISERIRAKEALTEGKEYTDNIIRSMADMLVVVSPAGTIVTVNKATCDLLGYSEHELLGKPATLLFEEEEEEEEEEEALQSILAHYPLPVKRTVLRHLVKVGSVSKVENALRTKGGIRIPVFLSGSIMRDNGGEIRGIVCLGLDISDRKRMENSLREAGQFLHSTFDAMLSHIAILDEDGRIVAVNEAWRTFARSNGVDPSRVCAGANYLQTCDQAIGEDAEEARSVAKGIRAVLCGEREKYSSEYPCHSPDEKRWFSLRVTRFSADAPPRAVVVHDTITERKLAEESLRESEKQFRGIIENVQDAYFCADTAGRFVMVSPSAARMYGFGAAEEMIGVDAATLYRFAEDRKAIADEVRRKGSIQDRIGEGRRKDGTTFWVSLNTRTFYDEQGRLLGTEGFVRDVTERKQAESNYRLMAETLRLWNRGGRDLHSLVRETIRVIKVLTEFDAVGLRLREGEDFPYYEQTGFSDAFVLEENFLCAKDVNGHVFRDATGQPMIECTCGCVLTGRTDPNNPCFTEGGSFWTNESSQLLTLSPEVDPRTNPRNRCIHAGYESVALIPLQSGKKIFGLLQLNSHRSGKFTPELVRFFEGLATAVGIALNRKRAEEDLQRSEMLLRAVTDSIPDPIFLKDRDSRMLFANPATLAIIGKPAEAVLGKTDAEFYDAPMSGDALMDNDRRIMEAGQPQSIEEIVPGPSGPRTFLSTKSPFRDGQGQVVGIVGVARDITDRKREEDALRQREAELAQLNRAHVVGEMAAALAHELNQPLYAISNYVGGIESRLRQIDSLPGSKEIISAIMRVSSEVNRAAAIVTRLREFVRGRDVHRSSVDIFQSLQHAIALMEPLARGKGVVLTTQTSKGLPIIQADPIQLEQVIVNLVANAIDAVVELPESQRRVTVNAQRSAAGAVEVVVKDRGRGVPPGLRDTLFEAFVSTKKDGLGVGLTISRTIIHAHGGKIWMVHHEPYGTSAHFTVPLAQTEMESCHAD